MTPAPEQEAGEGVCPGRHRDNLGCVFSDGRCLFCGLISHPCGNPSPPPAPSPHEGEAARCPGGERPVPFDVIPPVEELRRFLATDSARQEAIEKARAEGMDDLSFVDPSDLSDDELLAELDASLVGPEGSAFSGDERLTALVRDLMRRVAMNHSTGGGERG